METGKAFSFVFQDPNWPVKVLIGGMLVFVSFAISLIPVVGWIVAVLLFLILQGYQLVLMRNVINGVAHPLPEWANFGAFMRDGIIMFIITIVYLALEGTLKLCGLC
jgi:Protein of unknown function (DUF4013)